MLLKNLLSAHHGWAAQEGGLSERARINDRHEGKGSRTYENRPIDDATEFFNTIGLKRPAAPGRDLPASQSVRPAGYVALRSFGILGRNAYLTTPLPF